MNTNTLASGWEHVSLRGAAIIISPPALSSVSAATGRRDWKDFSDRFSRLKLKTQNSQISCKVLPSSSRERRPFIMSAPRTGCFTSCGSWLMFIAAVISHEQFMMLAFRIFLLLLVTSPQASFYLSAAQTSIRSRSVSNGVVISCRTFRDAYRDVCYYSKSIEALTCHSFKVTGLFWLFTEMQFSSATSPPKSYNIFLFLDHQELHATYKRFGKSLEPSKCHQLTFLQRYRTIFIKHILFQTWLLRYS